MVEWHRQSPARRSTRHSPVVQRSPAGFLPGVEPPRPPLPRGRTRRRDVSPGG